MSLPGAPQRLILKIEAAGSRFLLDAAQVVEVAVAPEPGQPLHGHTTLEDLSTRLGGDAEKKAHNAIVLDTSPTLALRVGRALGVADAAWARSFIVPPALARLLEPAVRGVIELDDGYFFEVDPEALAKAALPHRVPALHDLRDSRVASQSLVFLRAGQRYAVPLESVRQIVSTKSMLPCPLPGPLEGLVQHGGKLWPVWSPDTHAHAERSPLAVLVESPAGAAALSAESAEGVRQGAALEGVMPLNIAALFS